MVVKIFYDVWNLKTVHTDCLLIQYFAHHFQYYCKDVIHLFSHSFIHQFSNRVILPLPWESPNNPKSELRVTVHDIASVMYCRH